MNGNSPADKWIPLKGSFFPPLGNALLVFPDYFFVFLVVFLENMIHIEVGN